ncbi:L-lactate MFS transporter [Clostridium coskatii]|uniref:MFS-type transporter YhjX n=1 Tax=Clostridium coskatii TaxID=1705578 RepID=A0A162KZT3_9CLOT|nr:OFA family MFS transporter [Clostridium coskatii]OAA86456.1 putative MFS-type transporter YhjX [Clostridium coskatii]OBR92088.1 putative MFS-type transporter YhjX [Clostridium coskatii]
MKNSWEGQENRWMVILGTVIVQIGLGTFYTWSLFNQSLSKQFGWQVSAVALTFSIGSFALSFSTLFAGKLQDKLGIRKLSTICGFILGIGLILTSKVTSLAALYITAGVILGASDGIGYITTLSNAIKWFPEKKGLISGISVGAYGIGSLVFKYVNGGIMSAQGTSQAFMWWGIIAIVLIVAGSQLLKDAPVDPVKNLGISTETAEEVNFSRLDMLKTKEVYLLFVTFFTGAMSGLYMIGSVKDIGMQLAGLSAATAANAVALVAIFNTAGRIILGTLSDKIGALRVVTLTLIVTAAAVFIMSDVHLSFGIFFVCVSAIAFCFGGTVTVYPSIVGNFFGLRNQTRNYGLIYQGFGIGALSGSFISALLGGFKPTFLFIGVLCLISAVISTVVKPPKKAKETFVNPKKNAA